MSSTSKSRPYSALERLLRASVSALALAALPLAASAQPSPEITAPVVPAKKASRVSVLVEFQEPSAARVFANTMETAKAKGAANAREAAVAAARIQIDRNVAEQQQFDLALTQSGIATVPLYRATKAFNGIAYNVAPNAVSALGAIPGVKAVHLIRPEYPTLATSVPFLGTPSAWSGAAPLGATGQGVRIGIIDTGVDYQHPTFGGSGLLADYQANNHTVAPDSFYPNARVVGGHDFVGDAYDGFGVTVPTPDNDPTDCQGHGTHVASTAAGGGVNTDGTPFTGPYDGSTPFSTLRLAPGVAPQASVYSLRVFGCDGSTDMVVQAIDWAVDPNGDNDLSDHLDVINMSLGSSFGSLSDTSAMAADNAARMGVIVVASAGNSGDTYFITGSPGTGQRVVSIAATADSGLSGGLLRVNSPAPIAGDKAAGASFISNTSGTTTPFQNNETSDLVLATPNNGCAPLTNAAAVAGNIVLIDNGTCTTATKYNNAVAAGAIGVVIGQIIPGNPTTLSGTVANPSIPALMISQADATAIKNQLALPATVNVALPPVTQADVIARFSSRGPMSGGNGVGNVKPDLAAPGLFITAAQTGATCNGTTTFGCMLQSPNGFLEGGQSLTISGTSMAAPHAAGVMALLVQRFPDRSPEEIKAMAMNTALHDIYQFAGNINRIGVDRAGAGRVDPAKALQATVAAFNNDEAGAISLSYVGEVVGTLTQTKKLRVVNYGSTVQTFDLAIDTAVDAPGVAFSFPGGSSVTVAAGGTAFVDVQVSATAAQMNHVRDVSVEPVQTAPTPLGFLGSLPRHYLTNESGYVNFSQAGSTVLRVPVFAALRPASDMTAPAAIVTGGAPTGSTTLPLSGTEVCTGTLGAGPACTGTFPETDVSRVSAFELQASAPRNPALPGSANIKNAGVAYDSANNLILFGVSSWGNWGSPTETSFNIYIDSDNNGTYDYVLFNSSPGGMASSFGYSADEQDVFINGILDLTTSVVSIGGAGMYVNRLNASQAGSALFGSNVMVLSATPAQLGLPGGTTNFRYKIQTCPSYAPLCEPVYGFKLDEAAGPYSWNYGAGFQGLNFNGSNMVPDLNGSTLPVTWNTANMTSNGSLGALLLHHHNASGLRDEVVLLGAAQSADLAVSQILTPAAPAQGQNVTIAINASNAGPDTATGVSVNAPLPVGLSYVSDTGGGAYVPGTGVWNVGALANGASASLSIVATVTGSGLLPMVSQISGSLPDTVSGNNTASNTVAVGAQTTLALTTVLNSANPVLVGGASSFTLTLKNTGIDTLFNASVSATRAPAAPITASTPSSGSFNNATGIWTIPSIAGGATVTLNLTTTAPAVLGAFSVTADATAENAPAAQQAAAVNVISPAVVTATKTVTGAPFMAGSIATYTITLLNSGAATQFDNPGPEFTDVLPAGLTLVSASASSGTAVATIGTNTVTWNGAIPAAGTVTITITATVNPVAPGTTISNQGIVAFDADGNGTNEASAVTDNPANPGATDATAFAVGGVVVSALPVPSLSEMALAALVLLMFGIGMRQMRSRRN